MAYQVCLNCLHRSKDFSMLFITMHDKIVGDDWKCRSCGSRRHRLIQSNKEIQHLSEESKTNSKLYLPHTDTTPMKKVLPRNSSLLNQREEKICNA